MIYLFIIMPAVLLISVLFLLFGLNVTVKTYHQLTPDNGEKTEGKPSELKNSYEPMNKAEGDVHMGAFPVKVNDKIIMVDMNKIIAFCAEDNYLNLKDMDGNCYYFDYTLKSLLEKLPGSFLRIHRSVVLNKKHIKEIHKYFNGRYAIVMADKLNSKFTSSQSYSKEIKRLIEI